MSIFAFNAPFRTADFSHGNAALPSAGWNGTAGSGFGGAYGAVPTDPTRTTAKPVCRLITPPNQYFTDALLVGVVAAANDSGSLLATLGLSKVVLHYEGTTLDLTRPTWQTFDDANGNPVSYFAWWCWLKKPAAVAGHANVYFEAVPRDGTMQHRVIGPYQFSPQTALHDYSITLAATPAVVAGVRYQTLRAALDYLATVSAQNPLITVTEAHPSGVYVCPSTAVTTQPQGYCTIEATVPVVFGNAAYTTDAGTAWRSRWDGLHFKGSNITLDMANVSSIYHESASNRQHWFDGVTITDSLGRYHLQRKAAKQTLYTARDNPYFTECTITYAANACYSASLVRGCSLSYGNADALTDSRCIVGTDVHHWHSEEYTAELAALTVQYVGAGATATLELAGANSQNNRVFTAKVNGSSVGTFTILNTEAGFIANTNYTVENVVAWLNGLSGWTATALDTTRSAVALGVPGQLGAAFTATGVKTAPITLTTSLNQHSDTYQTQTTFENVWASDVRCWQTRTQNIFVGSTSTMKDVMFINWSIDFDEASPYFGSVFSQLLGAQSHVVMAHISSSNQALTLRTDYVAGPYNPDAYCLVANGTFPLLVWGGTPDAQLTITGNHLQAGATVPTYATGTTIGGAKASMFADSTTGDFTPAGALLTNAKAPVLAYDRLRHARAATDATGALAA